MKLNHINLVVSNVQRMIALFENIFDFRCVDKKGDNMIAILNGPDGFSLVLMKSKDEIVTYPEPFHIGFMLESSKKVSETFQKLRSAGIAVGREPQKIRNSFGFYFNFENLMIEVAYPINALN
jgi:catechol 2,3-dioxygenase-like lactoylglutathione lyase family enzyme